MCVLLLLPYYTIFVLDKIADCIVIYCHIMISMYIYVYMYIYN